MASRGGRTAAQKPTPRAEREEEEEVVVVFSEYERAPPGVGGVEKGL